MKIKPMALAFAAAGAAIALSGCGTDFEENYQASDAPVILSCSGAIKLPMYAPERFRMAPARYANTSWYRDAYLREVPSDALDYVSLPDYHTASPDNLQDRPIHGNVMPYEDYALGFYYVDEGGAMRPMDLYFNRFSTASEINSGMGALQFRYRFWAVAPAEATHIGLKIFDNPVNWHYANSATEQMDQIEEAWYGRQADGYLRAQWQGEPQGVSPSDKTPVRSFSHGEYAKCLASPYFSSELSLGVGFNPDGSNWTMRAERRESRQWSLDRWLSGRLSIRPSASLPDYIKGTATESGGKNHFMPLVALSESGFLSEIKAGSLEDDWFGDVWRQSINVWSDDWPEKDR